MSDVMFENLTDTCKRLEAYETPRWPIEAVLDVEVTTHRVVDPCAGTGIIVEVCENRGLDVLGIDIIDWEDRLTTKVMRNCAGTFLIQDFLSLVAGFDGDLVAETTVIMNPPFSLACEFVDKAQELGARKIICFQRQAWRESATRREWWEKNPPARVWVCGARATCWRFDLLSEDLSKRGGSTTSMAWYVWERGHKGAEITSAIYPREVA